MRQVGWWATNTHISRYVSLEHDEFYRTEPGWTLTPVYTGEEA